MTGADEEWWRSQIPEAEQVIWSGRPHQGWFPPYAGRAYAILITCLVLAWVASPWFADSVRDYWKLASCTGLLAFFMWWDRFVRSRRVYVVTRRNAWWISKIFRPRSLLIHPKLNFYRSGGNVVFSRLRFLVFEYLPDPNSAVAALTQAREAST